MKKIDFSRHSIADIKGWDENEGLEVQPDFQRRAVWSDSAKIMLIDSILKGIPLPKVFIASKIKDGKTYRIVIDGQQRITAILSFLADEFALKAPYSGDFVGQRYSQLPDEVQNSILSFRLDFNEFENYSDAEMREIYNRVNKYTFALNKQELRRADFPGEYLNLAERLSVNEFFDESKIFSAANRRRLGDVEYVSELLAILIDGPQDKKESLDSFYMKYSVWDESELSKIESKFIQILNTIDRIFSAGDHGISSQRFKQKSDFYSLFGALCQFNSSGLVLLEEKLNSLAEDFWILHLGINPHEPGPLGEYASRCLSDANSLTNRRWRIDFILKFLISASDQSKELLVQERIDLFSNIAWFLEDDGGGECPPAWYSCPVCDEEDEVYNLKICFAPDEIFLSSVAHVHEACLSQSEIEYLYSK